jgi:hypothetical protein
MAVQASLAQANIPFVLEGKPFVAMGQTLLTIAGRTVPLYKYTLMSQIASTLKWAPWLQANLGGTTGTQYPLGIYMGDDLTAAQIAAGDVLNLPIMVGGQGVVIDEGQLVFDLGDTGVGALGTLAVIPTVPTNLALTARSIMQLLGIFPKTVVAISAAEN